MAIDWTSEEVAVVFLPQLKCPHCHNSESILVRSERDACGDKIHKRICRKCSEPFKVIHEQYGDDEEGLADIRQAGF